MNRVNNQALLALVTASIFAVSLIQPLSLAEDSDYSYPANIFVDLENGDIITESSIISITIQNEELPTYATWELLDTSGTRFFIDFTEDLEKPKLFWEFFYSCLTSLLHRAACRLSQYIVYQAKKLKASSKYRYQLNIRFSLESENILLFTRT